MWTAIIVVCAATVGAANPPKCDLKDNIIKIEAPERAPDLARCALMAMAYIANTNLSEGERVKWYCSSQPPSGNIAG